MNICKYCGLPFGKWALKCCCLKSPNHHHHFVSEKTLKNIQEVSMRNQRPLQKERVVK